MKINAGMTIAEVLALEPRAAQIFMSHGSHCLNCGNTAKNTVADMARKHEVELDRLLQELNGLFS